MTIPTRITRPVAPHAGAWIETAKGGSASIPTTVAPHAGAWIETPTGPRHPPAPCRSPRGSVDRNTQANDIAARLASRSPRGSVDRNPSNLWSTLPAKVAPHAGAWIETNSLTSSSSSQRSLPTRERGSKHSPRVGRHEADSRSPRGSVDRNAISYPVNLEPVVAPHAGAWIETDGNDTNSYAATVAPHAGAWIETQSRPWTASRKQSLPTWERGSKPRRTSPILAPALSLPTWERGSKRAWTARWVARSSRSPRGSVDRNANLASDETRLRRRSPRGSVDRNFGSDGMIGQGRVAPHVGAWIETARIGGDVKMLVAPHVGAWIETGSCGWAARRPWSLPTWERGSKRTRSLRQADRPGRSPRGSVDRNTGQSAPQAPDTRRSPRGSVDRNPRRKRSAWILWVAPHVGAWIETRSAIRPIFPWSSLPTWERGSKPPQTPPPTDRNTSLPTWERGSKLRRHAQPSPADRRSPRGSVDRNRAGPARPPRSCRRSPRGSVDRNNAGGSGGAPLGVAPHVGAWIET